MKKNLFKVVSVVLTASLLFAENGITTLAAEIPEIIEENVSGEDEFVEDSEEVEVPEEDLTNEEEFTEENEETVDSEEEIIPSEEEEIIEEENIEEEISEDADETDIEAEDIEEEEDEISADNEFQGDAGDIAYGKLEDTEVCWRISKEGELFIYGECEGELLYNKPWHNYYEKVVKATVSISGKVSLNDFFCDMSYIEEVDFSEMIKKKTVITGMSGTFEGCKRLVKLDLAGLNVSQVKNMGSAFYRCMSLNSVNLSGWDTSNVTNMESMFAYCNALSTLDISSFDTSNVTSMKNMFCSCENLKTVEVSSFNTEKVLDMEGMFHFCYKLETVDITGFNTYNCRSFYNMFSECRSLKTLDVTKMDTFCANEMDHMFYNCYSLENLDTSNFRGSDVPQNDLYAMFAGCDLLTSIDLHDMSMYGEASSYSKELVISDNVTFIYFPKMAANYKLPKREGKVWVDEKFNVCEKTNTANGSVKYYNLTQNAADALHNSGAKEIPDDLWVAFDESSTYTYTGSAIKPEVEVYFGFTRLEAGEYTVSYSNNKVAAEATSKKAPTVTVKGKGNYSGTVKKSFTINKCDINDCVETGVTKECSYPATGKKQKPVPDMLNGDTKLTTKDYTVLFYEIDDEGKTSEKSLSEIKKAGKYLRVIEGKGNYTGKIETKITLTESKNISKATVNKIPDMNFKRQYGKTEYLPVEPELTVKYGTTELKKGVDYKVFYKNNCAPGKATVTIQGMGDYSGTKTVYFNIKYIDISKMDLWLNSHAKEWTGYYDDCSKNVYIEYEEEDDGPTRELDEENYDLSFKITTGYKKITVTATGRKDKGYTGKIVKTYKISKINIEKPGWYTPVVTEKVMYVKGGVIPYHYLGVRENTVRIEGLHYKVSCKNNNKVGKATMTFEGINFYTGKITVDFEVIAKPLYYTTVTPDAIAYTKKAGNFKTGVTLYDTNGSKLAAGTDYAKTLKYTYVKETVVLNGGKEVTRIAGEEADSKDIVPAGTQMKVTVTGKKYYTDSASAIYTISTKKASSLSVSVKSQEYTGKAITPKAEDITVKDGTKELTYGVDYVILSYSNNVNKGRNAKLVIKGIGNYSGTKSVSFTIKGKTFGDFMWLFN